MLGAIIGDVAGSTYEVEEIECLRAHTKRSYEERIKILNSKVSLFKENSSMTDDSILTMALLDAVLHDKNYEYYLRLYGNRFQGKDVYGRNCFGSGFIKWLNNNIQGTSYGNGSCMRISSIANYFDEIKIIEEETIKATIPSHNNEDAIICALAVSNAIYYARNNHPKEEIKKIIVDKFNLNLDYDIEDLRHNYTFQMSAINSVPQAIFCFLISNSFEEAIRNAISIGGDCDTIAAITGSISEAYYEIPENIIDKVMIYLDDNTIKLLNDFEKEKGRIKVYERRFNKSC